MQHTLDKNKLTTNSCNNGGIYRNFFVTDILVNHHTTHLIDHVGKPYQHK